MIVQELNENLLQQVKTFQAAQQAPPPPSLAATNTSLLTAASVQAQKFQAMQVQMAAL